MKKLIIKNLTKGLTVTLIFALAIGLTVGLTSNKTAEAGWYPGREIKTYTSGVAGFKYPTFNSFKNTNSYGDERTFSAVTKLSDNKNFKDTQKVAPGDTVILRAFYHNGADPKHNADGSGIAQNTRVKVFIPSGTSTHFKTFTYLSADNARYYNNGKLVTSSGKPVVTVYDTSDVTSDVPVKLEYIKGSAKMYNHAHEPESGGLTLSDSAVFTSGTVDMTKSAGGAKIGYQNDDGVLKGCFEYEGWVFVRAKVVGIEKPPASPEIKVIKKVKVEGSSTWFDANDADSAVNVPKGATVAYLIKFENSGDVKLNDVIIKDALPDNVSYLAGTTRFINSDNPEPGKVMSDGITVGGLDMGNWLPNAGGYLRFNAKISNDLAEGTYTLTNWASADADEVGPKKDPAVIKVKVIPAPPLGGVIEKAKSAFNETQGLDATITKSRAGDTIIYTLITKNSGVDAQNDFVVSDDLSDVLEYASVTDFGGGTLTGTTISYPAVNIAAGELITNSFKVKVKSASSWPTDGDKELENTYGNEVVAPVTKSPVTPTGTVRPKGGVSVLPATGPEDYLPLFGLAIVGALYFYYRKSRSALVEAVNTKTWS